MIGRKRQAEVDREEVRAVIRDVLKTELAQIVEEAGKVAAAYKGTQSNFLQVVGQVERMGKAVEAMHRGLQAHTHAVQSDGKDVPVGEVLKDLAELMAVLESELNTIRVDQNAYRDKLAELDARVASAAASDAKARRALLAALGAEEKK